MHEILPRITGSTLEIGAIRTAGLQKASGLPVVIPVITRKLSACGTSPKRLQEDQLERSFGRGEVVQEIE